jgi:hypothetical protein
LLAYFSLTLFVSATLLFLVQPMIGKMILPQLGGTPAVWNTCMVFFQGVLLVGYGYTHLLTTTQPTRRQVVIQGCMLFSPFLFLMLPFSLGDWAPPEESNPIFSLLYKLTVMVGLPFFMVSTTAPLLQKWFFHTGHPAGKDPYFLYGASNLGSMLGLALYPTVVEPWLQVSPPDGKATWATQVHLWTFGYALFVGLVVGCAVVVWQALMGKAAAPAEAPATSVAHVLGSPSPAASVPMPASATAITTAPKRRGKRMGPALVTPAASVAAPPPKPAAFNMPSDDITLWRRLRWIGLAAAPSSLMLGVTTYMTTDIAAVAFFWIIPLALYLFTFILVFARWPTVWTQTPHMIVMFVQPCLILFLVLKMIANLSGPRGWETVMDMTLNLAAFFSTTLMCHGELAKDRPSAKHLTEFYFWMSLGGVLGGLFNALFAPIVFQLGLWEYLIAMAFACLLRSNLVDEVRTLIPGDSTAERPTLVGYLLDFGVPILIGMLAYVATYYGDMQGPFIVRRLVILGALSALVIVLVACYYHLYADTAKESWMQFYHRFEHLRMVLSLAAICLVAFAAIFFADLKFDATFLMRRSYLLAGLVVVVLALSLRPIRFGLSIAALFIAMTVYERAEDKYIYEGRGFFGRLRVKETSAGDDAWARLPQLYEHQRAPYEWKVYRRLMHGGINHGQQIVQYKDDRAVYPVLGVATLGLMSSPMGEGALLAAAGLFPEGTVVTPEGEAYLPRTELVFTSREMLMRKRREPITYFYERNGVAELFYKLCWPKSQPVAEIANMNGASDARMPAAMVGLAGGDFAAWTMLANTQSEPPYAVVGLGTGILACYAKPYQHVDIYEIDPLVKNLSILPGYLPPWHPKRATMPKLPDPMFYFVHDAQERWSKIDVKLGDGRLKIKEAPENYYHVIALDAFSSDAIPVHLLTKEAVKLYLDKLAEGGVLIFNTTNRYVRIEGVLASIAQELGLECLKCSDWGYRSESYPDNTNHPDRFSADWVIMQRKIDKKTYQNGGLPIRDRLEESRKRLMWNGKPALNANGEEMIEERWHKVEPLPGPAWTDGYSNMLNPRVMPWLIPWRE